MSRLPCPRYTSRRARGIRATRFLLVKPRFQLVDARVVHLSELGERVAELVDGAHERGHPALVAWHASPPGHTTCPVVQLRLSVGDFEQARSPLRLTVGLQPGHPLRAGIIGPYSVSSRNPRRAGERGQPASRWRRAIDSRNIRIVTPPCEEPPPHTTRPFLRAQRLERRHRHARLLP